MISNIGSHLGVVHEQNVSEFKVPRGDNSNLMGAVILNIMRELASIFRNCSLRGLDLRLCSIDGSMLIERCFCLIQLN